MKISIKKNCSIAIVLLFTLVSCKSQVTVYDGFEKSELSKIWSTDRMVKNAFEIQ